MNNGMIDTLQIENAHLHQRLAEMEQQQVALQQRAALYHSLYISMTEGAVIHEMIYDPSGQASDYRILDVNPAFEAIMGIARATAVGRLASEVYGTGEAPYLDIYAQVAATGQPATFEADFAPLGRTFAVVVFSPGAGQFVTLFEDITERKRSEREREQSLHVMHASIDALRQSRARLQAIFDNVAAGIAVVDGEGNYLEINDQWATMLGCTPEEALRLPTSRIIHPDDLDDKFAQFQALAAGEIEHYFEEKRFVRKDGSIFWGNTSSSAIRDDQGNLQAIVGIMVDVTERKRAEAALQRRDAILESISLAARHFLSTPDLPSSIVWLLKRLGQAAGVDRIYIFENSVAADDTLLMSQRYEWCAPGIVPQINNPHLQSFPYQTGFERWEDALHQGKAIYGLVYTFPESERAVLEPQDIQSIAIVPIFVGQQWWGFMGFDICQYEYLWHSSEIDALRTAAGLLGAAIQRMQMETALRTSEEKYRTLFDTVPVALARCAPDGQFLDVNEAAVVLLGYPDRPTLLGENIKHLYVDLDEREQWQAIIAQEGIVRNVEIRMRRPDGRQIWVVVNIHSVHDTDGRLFAYEGSLEDITERKVQAENIERLAYTDHLTGLANRRLLYDVGEAALTSLADAGGSVALLYLDLDRFKTVNDTLGHDVGDDLLMQVAARLRSGVREGDTLARLGGDEFALLLPTSDTAQARVVAERMLAALVQPFDLQGHIIHLGGSIGVAVASTGGVLFSQFLTWADIAMYRAKAGGGGVQFYDPARDPIAPDQLYLETELRHALIADELCLYYQPILDLDTGQVVGVEALVRWRHPTRGMLAPDVFLPVAEDAGLLGVLDHWVLHAALWQASLWVAAGQRLSVAINMTAPSLQSPSLVHELTDLLNETGVPPDLVVIEVTEYTALRDLATTRQVLAELQRLGVRIALDDFGKGYASLAQLQQLLVDVLKVDRVFTAGIGNEPRDEAVVRAMITLGDGLNARVIVEGVEYQEQRAWLEAIGCHQVQGYLIGRPVPPEEMQNLVSR